MTTTTEISSIIRKRTLGLVFVLGAASMAFAQEQQKITISGSVVDKNNSAIPYASITFNNTANSTFSDADLTDDKGNYKIALVPGNYQISVEGIGFKKYEKTLAITASGAIEKITLIADGSGVNNNGQDVTELSAVTLTASTKAYKVELDKKVYDVSQDIVSKGGNLQDILNNVPSVAVDTDGSVSMRGNTNVRFLINGKPSSLLGIDDGANALQTIPAEQIERIEVITNPSSKFEASGTAGILNIILKKDKKMGFNGSVTGSVGYLPKTSLNANLNWRKGNWTWYVNGGGGYTRNESSSSNSTIQKIGINDIPSNVKSFPFTQTSIQDGKTKREGENYNINAGLVYDISDKTSINFSGMLRSFNNDEAVLNNYDEIEFRSIFVPVDINDPKGPQIEVGPRTTHYVIRDKNSNGNSKNLSTQFDFGLDQKLDDNGQNLTLSGSFQTNKNDGLSSIDTYTFENNMELIDRKQLNQITTNTKTKTFIGKADYELPIGEYSKLEAGARYDYNNNTYDYLVTEQLANGPITLKKDFTSNTNYSENILGIYAQFKSKIGEKFGYQVGLRGENSSIDIDFDYYDKVTGLPAHEKVNKDYFKLFPTVFLSYDLGNSDQLLVNYSRRINRPRAHSLIPFMSFSDDKNYFRGNSNLNPSYENSFEVGYSISKKKFTINPTLYYKKSEDEQNRFQYLDEVGAVNTVPYNVGSEQNYGLDLNGTYDPFAWWKMMLSADLYGYKNDGELTINGVTNDFSGKGFSYRLRFNNTFKIDKTFSFQIQSFYRAGEKTAMNHRKSMYGIDFGASKTIWNGNGTIALNLRDAFNTRRMRNFSNTPQFTKEMEMQWQPRQISLSFTYKFKQGEKVEVKKAKKDINNNYDGGDDMGGGM